MKRLGKKDGGGGGGQGLDGRDGGAGRGRGGIVVYTLCACMPDEPFSNQSVFIQQMLSP